VLSSFQHNKVNKYSLTVREMDVLMMLTKGYSTKMIADGLTISFETARSHLKNIYIKLHVNCGKEAISKALMEHII
jgi:DNA-binding NarL/FixJ family response regulator